MRLNALHRVAVQKTYSVPSSLSCVGHAYAARSKSRVSISFDFQSILFSSSILVESRFKTRFPYVDSEILELIPFTNGQYLLVWPYGESHLVRKSAHGHTDMAVAVALGFSGFPTSTSCCGSWRNANMVSTFVVRVRIKLWMTLRLGRLN